VQSRLNKEKDDFQDNIQKQHQDEINDLKSTETTALRQLEQY